jgi:hypothetical protein
MVDSHTRINGPRSLQCGGISFVAARGPEAVL